MEQVRFAYAKTLIMPMQFSLISQRINLYQTLKEGSSKKVFNYENVNFFINLDINEEI